MKKYRFYIILFILLSILISIVLFMGMVHIPYNQQKNELFSHKKTISLANSIDFVSFEQYNGHQVYYIGQDDQEVYVFDNQDQLVKKELIENLHEDEVKNYLVNEYGIDSATIKLTLGYENKTMSYQYILETTQSVNYLYFDALSGELIKTYEFGS